MARQSITLGTAGKAILVPDLGSGVACEDDSGLDQLVRVYTCPTAAVDRLIPKRYTADREGRYPAMFLMEAGSVEIGGLLSRVTLKYLGSRDGSLPAPRTSRTKTIQSASGQLEDFTAEVVYYAPSATITSWSRADGAPGFPGVRDEPKVLQVRYNGVLLSGGKPKSFDKIFKTEMVLIPSSEEVVPGRYWRITNTATRQYVSKI